ncbi:S-methyl-5-thioribose-1-phosphate isomerase [bacterium 3DAC]|nr:S-methyl-5-thioribose-1-phosphate isomerase [bacterium 3DAC]
MNVAPGVKPIIWDETYGVLKMLDQRKLPREEVWVEGKTAEDIYNAIKEMIVRGAPLLGIVGVFGLVLAITDLEASSSYTPEKFLEIAQKLKSARPTAVNLAKEIDRALEDLPLGDAMPFEIRTLLIERARKLLKRQQEEDMAIARHGLEIFQSMDDIRIMTICNTGALATGGIGTALGVIRAIYWAGKKMHVYPLETRPFLQGARLTAYELKKEGIPFSLIADGASAITMKEKRVRAIIVGADRIARNGDTANKIGTFMLATVAHSMGIPFFVAAPVSTFDFDTVTGEDIPIEERSKEEVMLCGGCPITPEDIDVYNPVFDVTPHHLITGIITELGTIWHPNEEAIREFFSRHSDVDIE